MRIDNFQLPNMISPADPKTSIPQASYQQVSTMSRESDISITTAQGDVVTFSQDLFSGSMMDFSAELSANGSFQTFTSASLTSESMGLEIQGDLNEEELADIKHLFKDLSNIAQDFFKGDTKSAMQDALKLSKHMGSLSEVNASFTETTFSSYSQSHHYLPELNAEFAEGFMEMEENENVEDIISKMLQSQWQQISEMLRLDKEEAQDQSIPETSKDPLLAAGISQQPTNQVAAESEETAPATLADTDASDPQTPINPNNSFLKHAEKMMDKIANTLGKHPRISPFAIPLADNAIKLASDDLNDHSTPNRHNEDSLRSDFMKAYGNWLMG